MTPLGETATIGVRGPGESFGEMALVSDDARRAATVAALEEAETFAVATHLTFDLDITPARDTANLERLAGALLELGARPFGIPDEQLASFQLDAGTLHSGST